MTIYERRRIALALLVTAVALPALWWAKKDNPIASPSVAAVDVAQGLETANAANIAGIDTPPGFLTGPSDPLAPLIAEPTGPPIEETFSRGGGASYRDFTVDPAEDEEGFDPPPYLPERLCEVDFLPVGTRITVENTDNGKRIECLTDRRRLEDGLVIVIHRALFVGLADLSDAPIPVRIRW
jgi:hypothetical protein